MTPEEMRSTAAKNSKFIKIEDGGSYTGKYLSCDAVPQQRDPEKETYRYTFEEQDGSKKFLETTSNGFLRKMAEIARGSMVRIEREGEGPDTRYEVFIAD